MEEACRSAERSMVQYRYRVTKAAVPMSPWARLTAIERELDSVSEAQHAALAATCSGSSPNSTLLPAMQQNNVVPGNLRPHLGQSPITPEGSGEEVLLQGFNWESWQHNWYENISGKAEELANMGFTTIWLPPFTQSVSPQGYMPGDLYNLNSYYGSEAQLRSCIRSFQSAGIKVLGDAVLNHRCAEHRGEDGVYNRFGGRLAWDERAIVGDDSRFRGRGGASSGTAFHAAPNIDHGAPWVKADLCAWLAWLRSDVGLDGWRLDFVRGFHGSHVRDYMAASSPRFAVGEHWDALAYDGCGVPCHDQDAHRQRIVAWINAAGGLSTAFDMTTKGILHAALERREYWRLRDAQGRAPGLLGFWPSRAVTFLENHDTGSSQGHWRFPAAGVAQGYAYCLTHPGTPCVFYDHLYLWGGGLRDEIRGLMAARRRARIHCRSALRVLAATADVYAAEVDARLTVKLGPGDWQPDRPADWSLTLWGDQWAVWERRK